jgi:hypothetical protein
MAALPLSPRRASTYAGCTVAANGAGANDGAIHEADEEFIMRTTNLLSVAGLFAVGSFFGAAAPATAQEATPDTWIDRPVQKTRAQVRAELARARADGTIGAGSANYDFVAARDASKSREQVLAELRRAHASGALDAIDAEAWAYVPVRPPLTSPLRERTLG